MTAQQPAGYTRAAGIALVAAAVAGAASRYCDCCGHSDHVPGQPCPCDSRDAQGGAR